MSKLINSCLLASGILLSSVTVLASDIEQTAPATEHTDATAQTNETHTNPVAATNDQNATTKKTTVKTKKKNKKKSKKTAVKNTEQPAVTPTTEPTAEPASDATTAHEATTENSHN